MPNKARKTSKTSNPPANVNPVAAAVAACFGLIYPVLKSQAAQVAENAKAAESRSATCVNAIRMLHETIRDPEAYGKACDELFGNGSKKKDERIVGTLRAKLDEEGVKVVQCYNTLHLCRVVAANIGRPEVLKAAEESGLRKAYDATKPAAPETETPADAAPAVVSLAGLIGDIVRIEGWAGVIKILKHLESAASVLKDSNKAQVVHDAAAKLAA